MTYLDYAATAPILPEVREAMREAEEEFFANASALHTPGHRALAEIERVRGLIARLIGAEPEEIIFTSGATESNNTVMRTFEGCEIEVSPLEHHSIIEAAREYRGNLRPKLYSYMLVNNEIGEILDLPRLTGVELQVSAEEIADNGASDGRKSGADKVAGGNEKLGADGGIAKMMFQKSEWGRDLVRDRREEYLHSDLTQALGKIPLDVNKLGLDYATFSAHKIGGPIGVGALYVRRGVPFRPLMIGGNQEGKRRGGTYNTVGIIGFGVALQSIEQGRAYEIYDTRVRGLRDRLAQRILAEVPGSFLNTNLERGKSLPNILNMSFKAAEGESIQLYLDAEGVVVSTGSACAAGDTRPSHVLMAKTGDAEVAHSSIRFSFGLDSTEADVERVMEVLPGIVKRLQEMSTIGVI